MRHRFVVPHRASGRLDSRLEPIVHAAKAGGSAEALRTAQAAGLHVSAGKLRLVVVARQHGPAAASAVTSAGGRVVMRAGHLVEALLAPSMLRSVARSPAVTEVRPPALIIPQAVDEGVAKSGADVWHNAGIDGSGVKVAIIDLGFAGYASLLGSALPATVTTDDRCDGNLATGTDHGTAVAELVHQMAPGAQLDLICVDSEVGLALAEQDAAADGVQIITQSLAWFGPDVGRGDGTGGPGSPDAVVGQARADGILWVNAAGNYAEDHWSGSFSPDSSDPGLNDFGPRVPYDPVTISSGEQACVVLTWDDWPATTEDLDLYLFRDSDGTLVAASTNDQSGEFLPPEEDLCYTNTGATDTFDIVVANYDAVGSPRIDLYYTGASGLSYYASAGSVVDPASSPDAFAVGAYCWSSPNVEQGVEPYSSYGPTIDGRIEPDLVAADDVSTATYGDSTGQCDGGSGFAGTSAAAPQVAGAAALLLEQQPGLTVPALTAALDARALTNGSTNPNQGEFQTAGNGLLTMGPTAPFGAIAWTDNFISDIFDGTGAVWTGSYSAQDPNWSADGSRLNVEWLNSNLGSIAVDGSDGQTITGSPNKAVEPVWSPDGSKVVFVPSGSTAISVFDIATGTTDVLVNGSDPEWSPDGSELAYTSGGDVWLMNADGTGAHQLTNLGDVRTDGRALSWSPDGSEIAFAVSGASAGIWLVGADGSGAHQITTSGYAPLWSPDGARIAYVDSNGTPPDVYVLDAVDTDGTHETTLYKYGWEYAPTWFSWTPVTLLRNVSPPVLSGTAQVGQTLATSTGYWQSPTAWTFAYQWYRCDSSGANCTAIAGATAESYTATSDDLAATLRVEVDATDGADSMSSRSDPSAVVSAAPPTPTAAPAISGTAEGGMTLSISSPGSWSAPVSRSYQWRRCDSDGSECSDISGATSTTYALTSDDVADTIRVAIEAVGAGGTSYLSSPQTAVVTAPVPTATAPPTMAGAADVGHTLSATNGAWQSSFPLTGYSYQWERCTSAGASCVSISGATAEAYTLASADAGHTVRVSVSAENAWGWSSPAVSATSSVVVGIPAAQTAPTVAGTAAVGQSLSATTGSWSWSPTGYSYQWERCSSAGTSCTTISSATAAAYTLATADVGSTVRLAVEAHNDAGWSSPALSAASSVVVGIPAEQQLPTVVGTAAVGKSLSATMGSWSWSPTGFGYRWQRCAATGLACTAIADATNATYRIAAADAGHRLAVTVLATNLAGTATATSHATTVVVARPAVRHRPSIIGTAKVGHRLRAVRGAWSGPPTRYRYQWLRCSSRRSACRAIFAAKRPTYRAGKRDLGHRLRVRITAINAAGRTTASSATTRIVRRSQ